MKFVVVSLLVTCALAPARLSAQRPMYDRVILGGRVMDPASGLDAVRNVGVNGGKIAIITSKPIRGRDTLNAKGLVVAPGFIDMHAHGQNDESYGYYAMDGVTTALEMESGVWPIERFYARHAGRARVNYGATASHGGARRVATGETIDSTSTTPDVRRGWSDLPTRPAMLDTIRAELRKELDAGGLGIGIGVAYTPGASQMEILRVFDICAERKVLCFTHMRGGLAGWQEVVSDALTSGASLHVVHLNSSASGFPGTALKMVRNAQKAGIDVSTEMYPYTMSSTSLQSALYDSALVRPNYNFGNIIWAATGEHLTRETFIKYRAVGGTIIQLGMPDSAVTVPISDPMVMIASDAVPYVNHRGNPRLAGTFARVLGKYSRDEKRLTLMDGLRRMTIMPAKRLQPSVPQMAKKGRLGVGMDADITVFDAARIIDKATVEEPAQYSAGIVCVLVNGVPVVRGEKLVEGAVPGQPIRRPVVRAPLATSSR